MNRFAVALLCGALFASGCTVNPVTGKSELAIVTPQQEVAIGENNYAPSRQMQGGDLTIDPELTAYVQEVGQRLAAVSDRKLLPYEFQVLNSSIPNAWALPGGKIAINRGLLWEMNSEAELAAVMGHEIVHAAARHGAQAMQRGLLLQGAVFATAVAAQRKQFGGLAVGAANVAAQLVNQRYGRNAELESDRYGMIYMSRAGYDPDAAIDLQQTFVRLSEGRSTDWLSGLFASHPPSQQRVDANRATAQTLPDQGDMGRERYAAKLKKLRDARPAYETYDKGRKALAEGNLNEAETLGQSAISALPQEGHFHALLGDIDLESKRNDNAVRHFDAAIERNSNFFYYPLRRGLARKNLNLLDSAEADLQTSVEMLPTADAYQALGAIAESRGDINKAKEYYAAAGGSQSESGRAARSALLRLDLPTNPGKYLGLATGLDGQGQLLLELRNPTDRAVRNIEIEIEYLQADGSAQRIRRTMRGTLAPGSVQQIATGLGPFTSNRAYRAALVSARLE